MPNKITVSPSGQACVANDGQTILEASLSAGFLLPYSCRNGTCGVCKGKLLEGRVESGKSTESVLLPAEREAGMILFCCAKPLTDVTIACRDFDVPGDIRVKRLLCRVRRTYLAAPDVMVVRLELAPGKRLQFVAGQYIEIMLDDGQRRAFSIANAPHEEDVLELHIQRRPGGVFTSHVFDGLSCGECLRIEGPYGNFRLDATIGGGAGAPLIMVAGGTGFAPVKSIVEDTLRRQLVRPIFIYWGARRPEGLYMHELALEWAARHAHIQYVPVLSAPLAQDAWQGRTGAVHQAVTADHPDLSAADIYLCGSEKLIAASRAAFLLQGARNGRIHSDVFSPAPQLAETA